MWLEMNIKTNEINSFQIFRLNSYAKCLFDNPI